MQHSSLTLEIFDSFFSSFYTFESFSPLAKLLEFNIDVEFIFSQTISKTFLGFVFNFNYLNTNIVIQIEPFQNF